jgi:hypothetical protein
MSKWLKRLLATAGVVVVNLGASASTVYVTSERKFGQVQEIAMVPLEIPTDAASLERGRHVAASLASWTEADFIRAMRTGQRPDGTMITPFMPWLYLGQMTDDELGAVWLHLRTVESVVK